MRTNKPLTIKKPNFREILVGVLVYVKSKSFLAFKDLLQVFLRHNVRFRGIYEKKESKQAIKKSRDVFNSF